MILALTACGAASADDPELAAQVSQALQAKGLGELVHDVTATTDGEVDVMLNVSTGEIGSLVEQQDVAQGIAVIVWREAPEARNVTTFDGDLEVIGVTYDRPE